MRSKDLVLADHDETRAMARPKLRRSRQWMRAVGIMSILILVGCGSGGSDDPHAPAREESLVAHENRKPGSNEWQFWRYGWTQSDDAAEQIKGYASATSVDRGGHITLLVSVNPPQPYTIDVYRIGWYGGRGGSLVATVGPLAGTRQPECPIDATTGLIACTWEPSYTLEIPRSWLSGIYLGVARSQQGFASFIMFVVRDDERTADVLYQQSVTTYQAYNDYPSDGRRGKSLYGGSFGPPTIAGNSRAVQVSFDRPYANDGAGQFLAWEVGFVRWLERSGYDVSYTTDVDTHLNGGRLLASKAFLSVGHDEYWSKEMFDAVEAARDAGVHLGFFGGNTAYWQVRFAPSATGTPARVMICYKDATLDPTQGETTTVKWRDPPVMRPEQRLVGLQFGDIIRDGIDGAYADYAVSNGEHWIYAGTGLQNGDVIPGIVGYESDRYDENVPLPSQRDASWILLSVSPYESFARTQAYANSAIYQAPSGAWVFAAGTIGWSLGLDDFPTRAAPDARLQRTTQNILNRFVR